MDKRSMRYCNQIRDIIREIENSDVNAAEIWPLLRVLHLLSLDLATSTAHHEAAMKTQLAQTAGTGGASAATATWNERVVLAGTAMPAARRFRRSELPAAMQQRHAARTDGDRGALDLAPRAVVVSTRPPGLPVVVFWLQSSAGSPKIPATGGLIRAVVGGRN